MPRDRTADFKDVLRSKEQTITRTRKETVPLRDNFSKEYVAEAYKVLNSINALTHMLSGIRKAYLDVNSRPGQSSQTPLIHITLDGENRDWVVPQRLTNEERDMLDRQAKDILSLCSKRVKEMEALEKRRAELLGKQKEGLLRFLPTVLRQDSASSDLLALHHLGITWYLGRRLAEASQRQKEMQEERIKRQLERTRTLGSGAAKGVQVTSTEWYTEPPPVASTSTWLGDASTSFLAATIGTPTTQQPPPYIPSPQTESTDDDDDDIELSESQILQFEQENADMLRTVQDTLESVQQAESRLMDISTLQMELMSHLTQQTELTDQLYEDAIATTSTVEKGNAQLREAKRRSKDSRLFILVFLIGASLSLLFLHYY